MIIDPFSNSKVVVDQLKIDLLGYYLKNWYPVPMGNFILNTMGTDDLKDLISIATGTESTTWSLISMFLGDGVFNIRMNGFLIKKDPIVIDGLQMYLFDDGEGTYSVNNRPYTHEELQDAKYQYKFYVWPMIDAETFYKSIKASKLNSLAQLTVFASTDDLLTNALSLVAEGTDLVGVLSTLVGGSSGSLFDALHDNWAEIDDYSAFERHETVGYVTGIHSDQVDLAHDLLNFTSEVVQSRLDDLLDEDTFNSDDVDVLNKVDLTKRFESLAESYSNLKVSLDKIDPEGLTPDVQVSLAKAKTDSVNLSKVDNIVDLSKQYADEVSSNLVDLSKHVDLEDINDISKNTVDLSKGVRKLKVNLGKDAIKKLADIVDISLQYKRYFDGKVPNVGLSAEIYTQEQDAIERYFSHIPLDRDGRLKYTYLVDDMNADVVNNINLPDISEWYIADLDTQASGMPVFGKGGIPVIDMNKLIVDVVKTDDSEFDLSIDCSVFFYKGIGAIYECIRPFNFYFIVNNGVANLVLVGAEVTDASAV